MKKRTHELTEPVDKQRFKKNYLRRKQEEQEAEEEIENYTDGSDVDRQYGQRPQRRQRGSRKLS